MCTTTRGRKREASQELRVYQLAFESALEIYLLTRNFPADERYSLTDQIRRSSRSVCANVAEAWRKRRYPKSFVSKLSDADAEATETLVWLDFALRFEKETRCHTASLAPGTSNFA